MVETDVVVVGAGMGGLTAAVRASELGVDVLVLEKGARAGGSMYISSGIIWTFESIEEARERVPRGDRELQQLVVEGLPDAFEWLRDHDVALSEPASTMSSLGRQLDPGAFTPQMIDRIENEGGRVLLETPMEALLTDDEGVTGVLACDADGSRLRVEAESVVLATGGFQGDEALLERYVTDRTDRLWLRANSWSTGDGLRAATDVGAKLTGGLGTFYGHALPAPPAEFVATEFTEASQYYGPWTVALDERGRRFTDESRSPLEETLNQDIATRAEGRAYYVFDNDLYEWTIDSGKAVSTLVEWAEEFGGRVAHELSIDDLCGVLSEWGVNGAAARETIAEYNAALEDGTADGLDPPRRDHHRPVETAPFHAVEVQPGITFTMGGLDVDGTMSVLRRAGSTSTLDHYPEHLRDVRFDTVPGLYAAGVDVGDVNNRRYMGGLSLALVSGLIAGKTAAKNARSPDT